MRKTIILLFFTSLCFSQKINEGKITYNTFYNESEATDELKRESLWQYQLELKKLDMAKNFTFELHYKDSLSCFKIQEKLPSDNVNIKDYKLIAGQFYGNVVFISKKTKILAMKLVICIVILNMF